MRDRTIITESGYAIDIIHSESNSVSLKIDNTTIPLNAEEKERLIFLLNKSNTCIEVGDTVVASIGIDPDRRLFEFEVEAIRIDLPWPYSGVTMIDGKFGLIDARYVKLKKER